MKVIPIEKSICDEFVTKKHYSHRPSIFWNGFALVIDSKIEGIVVYGQPSPAIQSYAFEDRKFRMFELSRLVIQTEQKNAASFLIANSLKMLESPSAVVSYADTEMGHVGIVYQATNWLYTGATVSHDKTYVVDGVRTHQMTLRDKGVSSPVKWARENGIEMIKPQQKHRYFYLNGNKYQKKEMLSKLKYSVEPYPKADKVMYNSGERIEKFITPSLDC